MFRSYCFTTIILAVAASWSQALCAEGVQTPSPPPTEQVVTEPDKSQNEASPFPVIIVESGEQADASKGKEVETREHDARELDAQIRAANAAEKQIFPAWIGVLVGAIGTVLLVWTLFETRKAAKAAWDAADSARNALHSDRAWITPNEVWADFVDDDGNEKIQCGIRWENTGRSPALRVKFGSHISFVGPNAKANVVKIVMPSDAPYFVLGANKNALGAIYTCGKNVTPEMIAHQTVVHLCGRAEYVDIYQAEKVRVSEVFYRVFVHKSKEGRAVVQAQPIGPQNFAE
ncbi:hypothetical protein O3S81_13530 [Agrobacterium sp. SOY23]|uniref:hypothetical protein n=1 Tax=Agrobacterium sp. SOY23 TaxID=3014555 RepID=UPI0022AE9B75|nr:hypothetical protein [Agrobacterium sp. SOY23]MCZ4430721.1 hypothetical protein [Agrobacterium sp. SOY23]